MFQSGTQPSTSFCYKKGSDVEYRSKEDVFKSPLKIPMNSKDSNKSNEAVKPLLHTVSFYRRSQQQVIYICLKKFCNCLVVSF